MCSTSFFLFFSILLFKISSLTQNFLLSQKLIFDPIHVVPKHDSLFRLILPIRLRNHYVVSQFDPELIIRLRNHYVVSLVKRLRNHYVVSQIQNCSLTRNFLLSQNLIFAPIHVVPIHYFSI